MSWFVLVPVLLLAFAISGSKRLVFELMATSGFAVLPFRAIGVTSHWNDDAPWTTVLCSFAAEHLGATNLSSGEERISIAIVLLTSPTA